MKKMILDNPVLSFFFMAIVFSWIAVTPLLINPSLPVEPFQILGALAGPTLSAVIVIAVTEGRIGLGRFFKRYIQVRAGIVWWLIVLFGILIALTLVATGILGLGVMTEFIRNLWPDYPHLSDHLGRRDYAWPAVGGARLAWFCPTAPTSALWTVNFLHLDRCDLGCLAHPGISGRLDDVIFSRFADLLYRLFNPGYLDLQQHPRQYLAYDLAAFVQQRGDFCWRESPAGQPFRRDEQFRLWRLDPCPHGHARGCIGSRFHPWEFVFRRKPDARKSFTFCSSTELILYRRQEKFKIL